MSQDDARALIMRYYDAFGRDDPAALIACLSDDVRHDINQGPRELGRAAFAEFMTRMARCYRERLSDLVIMIDPSGTRAAAEYVVHGQYLQSDDGLPPAHGQSYSLPGAACFEISAGAITRVSNYYNLQDWLKQVAA